MPIWQIIQWVAISILVIFAGTFIVMRLSKDKITKGARNIFAVGIIASMLLALVSAAMSP